MDVDKYGHREVIKDVKIELPQRPVRDGFEVKVGGAEFNILP